MDLSALKFDNPRFGGEEGVIIASADVEAGLELCSTLANDDGPGFCGLSAVELDASELGIGVATVFGGTLSFFMCHIVTWGGVCVAGI